LFADVFVDSVSLYSSEHALYDFSPFKFTEAFFVV
jgi:hypothetical protein